MSCLTSTTFPGDDTPIIIGSALKALEGDDVRAWCASDVQKLVETLDSIFLSLSVRLTSHS